MEKPYKGLYPCYLKMEEAAFHTQFISLGALGDSFYEILFKQWVLSGKTDEKYFRMTNER